ncbi:MAG TPA: DUF1648 domain-containing protein [Terracidiphilus sp.]|nr:DUF1648 domain-containing protein [Terracidiphilus sp.]
MRKTLEAAGLLALAILVWITWSALYGPNRLPDRVPTHFDAAGNPNAWGSPSGMLFMPVIAGLLYLLMSVVTRFPDSFHYPVRATSTNIARLQAVTVDMIAWLKVELACLFLTLQWAFVQSAHSGNGRVFPTILPVSIVVIFATIGWHLLALVRIAGRGRA